MIKKYISVLSVFALLSSCSFKPATGVAAQELVNRGAFPGETPGWVSQSNLVQARNSDQGSFASPVVGGFKKTTSQNVISRQVQEEKEQKLRKAKQPEKEQSGLDRILEVCPRIEQELSKALITADVSVRIQKYETLTRRCAISADLWVWLGNDYLSVGQNVKAHTCAQRAISIDSNSKEASELIQKLNKRQFS